MNTASSETASTPGPDTGIALAAALEDLASRLDAETCAPDAAAGELRALAGRARLMPKPLGAAAARRDLDILALFEGSIFESDADTPTESGSAPEAPVSDVEAALENVLQHRSDLHARRLAGEDIAAARQDAYDAALAALAQALGAR